MVHLKDTFHGNKHCKICCQMDHGHHIGTLVNPHQYNQFGANTNVGIGGDCTASKQPLAGILSIAFCNQSAPCVFSRRRRCQGAQRRPARRAALIPLTHLPPDCLHAPALWRATRGIQMVRCLLCLPPSTLMLQKAAVMWARMLHAACCLLLIG